VRAGEIAASFLKTLAAGIFMAVAVYLLIGVMPLATPIQLFFGLAVAGIFGVAVYALATLLLRSPEIISVKNMLFKRRARQLFK
jgi:hypothetical protein